MGQFPKALSIFPTPIWWVQPLADDCPFCLSFFKGRKFFVRKNIYEYFFGKGKLYKGNYKESAWAAKILLQDHFPISYFTPSVIPFQSSVLKGPAGKPSLLNKLSSRLLSAHPYRTAMGAFTLSLYTTTVLPLMYALA